MKFQSGGGGHTQRGERCGEADAFEGRPEPDTRFLAEEFEWLFISSLNSGDSQYRLWGDGLGRRRSG